MSISDLSVRRPVLAVVFCLLVIVFGGIAFTSLPLRELPDVDRPVVGVDVSYRGASAQVVETTVVRIIEDQLSGIEGIDTINSTSRDGRGSINVEFDLSRDLEDAANDVRNAIDRARGQLPADIDPPVVSKQDADADPIIWINLQSTNLDLVQLTDYAERNIVDRLSTLPGVASVRIGGSQRKALRIWLDADALAARGLTVTDVEDALRTQNLETPAGYVESAERVYNVRTDRIFNTPEDFARMAVGRGDNQGAVRLGDVARIELAPEETRRLFRGNGANQIGLGVVRQSKSNALDVAAAVRKELEVVRANLPSGTDAVVAFDTTVFIDKAIHKVWETLAEAIFLVVLVIVLFLGSFRAAAIPAAVIPVCLIGSFALLAACGFSINLLTLLALVLSIGLVVDDSIVVLENAQRRVDQYGEPAPVAAMRGTRQVFFAVVATSAVLVAVFAPLLFVGGYVGRLFIELAVTVAGVVVISMIASLTLTPMMCSKMLRPVGDGTTFVRTVNSTLDVLRRSYRASLDLALHAKPVVFALFGLVIFGGWFVMQQLPSELTRPEDRGNLLINVQAPEGSGFEYTRRIMDDVEKVLLGYVERKEATRILVVAPGFGDQGANRFNSGLGRVFLADWEKRERSGDEIIGEMNRKMGEIPGAVVRVSMQNPLAGGGGGNDVSLVLGGQDYPELADIADRIVAKARENPQLIRPRMNYEPTNPRAIVDIDLERAAALGVSVQTVGRTLEATMGARRVNTITDRGREYYVYLQAERTERSDLSDLGDKFVRSDTTGALVPLSSVVTYKTVGETGERRRLDRLAAVSIAATLGPDYAMGDALDYLEGIARAEMGAQNVAIGYQGAAKQFKDSTGAIVFAFGFALLIVFLVLAAQFESFIHPLTIMMTVPLAVAGGVFGLFMFDNSFNIYSQIGLIILIALAAKNGILLVEFANQLRDEGREIREAILEASDLRLRPILMTSIATVIGAVPLMIADGAGAESRQTIGVVIVFGVTVATMMTLFVVPVFYDMLARFTRSPEAVAKDIERYETEEAAAQQPAE
ncbi:MAG: efflux RND transporter permease subunit [Alphaproteobacteria bacterium]|nr:efflux RND transporter permease subunit [Alphaproteobacteria bacterium]